MIDKRHLDIRTSTMGISLLDCADSDVQGCARKIYDKIVRKAENLVKVGQDIEWEFGIPIVNKRISVTPISLVGAACRDDMRRLPLRWYDAAAFVDPSAHARAEPDSPGAGQHIACRRIAMCR